MEEPLEIPIMNDLTMVLGSISQVNKYIQTFSLLIIFRHIIYKFIVTLMLFFFFLLWQSKETGVVIDFTEPSKVYDNVKQVKSF